MDKGIGQYDLEYMNCPCFWGVEPAKFVRRVTSYISSGEALDLGAGEGKNAVYLAKLGFNVVAIEVSYFAVRNFLSRIIDEKLNDETNIVVVRGDVIKLRWPGTYDLIVAYGLLHCLASVSLVEEVITKMKEQTRPGGYNVISCFTNRLPIPSVQDYLQPTLLDDYAVRDLYSDWQILEYELDEITETHPTSKKSHKHSLCRMIATRPT